MDVVLIVFDVSHPESLDSVTKWKQVLEESCTSYRKKKPFFFVIGNKRDTLSESNFLSIEKQAIQVSERISAEYWSVSAKTGNTIDELFARVSALTFQEVIYREMNDLIIERPISGKKIHTSKDSGIIRSFIHCCCKKTHSFP